MANSSWIETKRDADLDEKGNPVVKKIQLEPASFSGRYRIDLTLRIIGLIAIVTPIILVYLQQKAGLDTQKAIKQLDVYSATASELNSISRRPVTSKAFQASKEQLAYSLPPQIAFLFSQSISQDMEAINQIIPVYEAIANNVLIADSLFIHGNEAASSLGSYSAETIVHFDDSLDVLGHLQVLDSCRRELAFWFRSLQELKSEDQQADTAVDAAFRNMLAIDNQLLQFHTSFVNAANTTYLLLKERQSPAALKNQSAFEALHNLHKQLLAFKPVMNQYRSVQQHFHAFLGKKIAGLLTKMRTSNTVFRD